MLRVLKHWRGWVRKRRPQKGISAQAVVRLKMERLEDRSLPSSTGPVQPGALPFADNAPWSPHANRRFVEAEPQHLLSAMYFNTASARREYVENFAGVLRTWVAEADGLGIDSDADLMTFLGNALNAKFAMTRDLLARQFPGLPDETYRLLMTMNLVHGYFAYGPVPLAGRSLEQTAHLVVGDCVEISDLLLSLVRAQGIPAHELAQSYHYLTPQGRFVASHDVVYADGMWLDAEINTAFGVNLSQLRALSPDSRLQSLLNHHQVFGFYDFYLQPQVRLHQLREGQDGGIIAFYYQYYFEGIGKGHTRIYFVPGK
jgi:hypothetical protein